MFCDKCGSEIPNDSQFCPSCGNPVGQAPVDMRNTAYRNLNLGNVGANYPGAQAPVMNKRKRNFTPIIIVAVALIVAAGAVFGAMKLIYKPYMKPIDKLYKAYNTANRDLLYEAVTDELYESWNLEASHEKSPKVSYKVLNKDHIKGSDLFMYSSSYGAEDCYRIVMRDKIAKVSYYDEDDDYYGVNTFTVCKIGGKWKICEVY